MSLQPPCECVCSTSCWAELWQKWSADSLASLQMSKMDIHLYQLLCCLLLSDSVTLTYVTSAFQVSSAYSWAPLPLVMEEEEGWFTQFCCCRAEIESHLTSGSLRSSIGFSVSKTLLALLHCFIATR